MDDSDDRALFDLQYFQICEQLSALLSYRKTFIKLFA
jgi:hypothetical protein